MRSRIQTFALATTVLALGGCGSGGGGSTESSGEEEAGTFRAPDVAFTFKHPEDFKQENADDGKVLARLEPNPSEPNDAIKVRLTSARELPLSAFLDTFQRQFAAQVGPVDKRIETHSGEQMGVLEFTQSITRAGKPVQVTSTSYFFSGGGKTWQLECVATGAGKSKVDPACNQAVDSISFS